MNTSPSALTGLMPAGRCRPKKAKVARGQSNSALSGKLTRSEIMARIRSKNTTPELAVRQALHAAGLRFRLHRTDLPGRPDIVFPGRRTVVFVHGCFWHSHPGCKRARIPGTRQEYWVPKLLRNVERDQAAAAALRSAGWRVLIVWECETRLPAALTALATLVAAEPQRPSLSAFKTRMSACRISA